MSEVATASSPGDSVALARTDTARPPIFEVQNLTKRYGGYIALRDVTLRVSGGGIGLLGPNGAGKSTLIKTLLGLAKLTAGRAWLLGQDIRQVGAKSRTRVGYMFEDDALIPGLTGVEMVAYAGRLSGLEQTAAVQRAHEVLDYLGMGEERYRGTDGYSLGMRQKLKLGQALVHSPELIFLDEPTSGLDPDARERMLLIIRDLWENKGIDVVISTHILTDIERSCDSVIIVHQGQIVEYDTLANLQETKPGNYSIRFTGDPDHFRSALEAEGVRVTGQEPSTMHVETGSPTIPGSLFSAAGSAGVRVSGISPQRSRLEDIFLRIVEQADSTKAMREAGIPFAMAPSGTGGADGAMPAAGGPNNQQEG